MMPVDYLKQAALYRAAFNDSPDAIILVASDGTILLCNTQAELLTGQTNNDLLGKKVETLVPAELRDRHRDHRDEYLRNPVRRLMGPNLVLTILQTSEDGPRPIEVDVNLAPVTVDSLGVVVIATIRQKGSSLWNPK